MNSILINVPSILKTDRLLLRMPYPGDGQVVNDAIRASHAELSPWLKFAQEIPTVEETEINIREAHSKFLLRENLRYLVFLKDTEEFVGSTGFHNINWDVPKLEIGYWMDTRFSKKGYMTEAVHRITESAFADLQCRRVEIRCESDNWSSRSIPERLGFNLDGTLRYDDLSVDGKRLTDTCIYSKTN